MQFIMVKMQVSEVSGLYRTIHVNDKGTHLHFNRHFYLPFNLHLDVHLNLHLDVHLNLY